VCRCFCLCFLFIALHFKTAKPDIFDSFEQNKASNVLIESDSAKRNANETNAIGRVVVKDSSSLLNTENAKFLKLPLEKEQGIIEMQPFTKIRQENGDFIYTKSLLYDKKTRFGVAEQVQFFPSNLLSTEIIADSATKNEDVITFHNSIISLCLFEDDNIHDAREKKFEDIEKNKDWEVAKPKRSNILDNDYNLVRLRNHFSSISLKSPEITYNTTEKKTVLKHNVISILGLPILYIPYLSFGGKEQNKTGFLMPKFVVLGTRQAGIELPFYVRVAKNTDFIISRTQYFKLWGKSISQGGTDQSYGIGDLGRERDSINSFQFRHLFSESHGMQSFLFFEGDLTDKTIMVNNTNGRGLLDDNGNLVYGHRGFFNLISKIKLSKTTFFDIDWMYSSDKNYMFIYHLDYRQSKINNISLFDVDKNRYIGLELLQFQPFLFQFDRASTPQIMPVLRGEYKFDRDKIGGILYTRGKFNTIERQMGYSHTNIMADVGYELPYEFSNGFKITGETIVRGQYDNVRFNPYSSAPVAPDNRNFFGNYAWLMQNAIYNSDLSYGGGHYGQIMNFNKIQAQMPFIFTSDIGYTIFEPKVAFKYSPNGGRNSLIPNDDLVGMKFNHLNAFSLLQSSGYGMYDAGGSVIYGGELTHKFPMNITINTTVAQSNRVIDASVPAYILPEYSGYQSPISDTVGSLNVTYSNEKFGSIFTNIVYRHDNYLKQLREFYATVGGGSEYYILGLTYSQFAKNATIYNRSMELFSFYARIMPTKDLEFFVSGAVNLSSETSIGFPKGHQGLTQISYGASYSIACIQLMFGITENYMQIGNVSGMTTYRFTVRFNGIG
jgi:lipopolysaccharide assembly outer membrane protein LptD (OstA)